MREQIQAARDQGYFVPFCYTVPDGHNPAGFLQQKTPRRNLSGPSEEGVLVLEDAPYLYQLRRQKTALRPF